MNLGPVLFRGLVGPLFMGHGAQKLWGKFGGHGLEGTGGFFEQLGLSPGRKHAAAAGAAEFTGGALLTAGALTPLASTLISTTMITAIRTVHGPKGPWVAEGGWEYNAALIAALAAITERGPGEPSVDSALFPQLKGKGWAVGAMAAATAASFLATSNRLPGVQATDSSESPPVAGDPATVDDDTRFRRDDAPTEPRPTTSRERL